MGYRSLAFDKANKLPTNLRESDFKTINIPAGLLRCLRVHSLDALDGHVVLPDGNKLDDGWERVSLTNTSDRTFGDA